VGVGAAQHHAAHRTKDGCDGGGCSPHTPIAGMLGRGPHRAHHQVASALRHVNISQRGDAEEWWWTGWGVTRRSVPMRPAGRLTYSRRCPRLFTRSCGNCWKKGRRETAVMTICISSKVRSTALAPPTGNTAATAGVTRRQHEDGAPAQSRRRGCAQGMCASRPRGTAQCPATHRRGWRRVNRVTLAWVHTCARDEFTSGGGGLLGKALPSPPLSCSLPPGAAGRLLVCRKGPPQRSPLAPHTPQPPVHRPSLQRHGMQAGRRRSWGRRGTLTPATRASVPPARTAS
jgi:hypothetical protein